MTKRTLSRLSAHAAHAILHRTGRFRGKHRLLRTLGVLSRGAPIRSAYGPLMEANLGDMTNYFAVAGYPDDTVARAIAELRPGDGFIDIGANAGLFSLIAKGQVGDGGVVVAFEPQWALAHSVRRNAALNRLEGIHVLPFALGPVTEAGKLKTSDRHSGTAHIEKTGDQEILIVDPSSILSLVQSLIGRRRVSIKIDVEGAEQLVVEAISPFLTTLKVTTCIVEIDDENLGRFGHSAASLYSTFAAAGFRPRFGLNPTAHYDEIFDRELDLA